VIVANQDKAEPEIERMVTRSRARELAKEAHTLIAVGVIKQEEAEADIFNISTLKLEEPCNDN